MGHLEAGPWFLLDLAPPVFSPDDTRLHPFSVISGDHKQNSSSESRVSLWTIELDGGLGDPPHNVTPMSHLTVGLKEGRVC